MSRRLRIVAVLALSLALGAPVVHAALTAPAAPLTSAAPAGVVPAKFKPGEELYREFCGQCHILKEARAVGFGSGKKLGPGEHAGPSFDPLRVPWQLSVLAVLGHWDGHDRIVRLMTWDDIYMVACYVEHATKDHAYQAVMPSHAFLPPGVSGNSKRCAVAGSSGNANVSVGLRGTLSGTLTAARKLTLTFKGKPVRTLKAGRYTVTLVDQSATDGLSLQRIGQRAVRLTAPSFVGRKTVTLNLPAGLWTFSASADRAVSFTVRP